METITYNDLIFNLLNQEDKLLNYISNKIIKKITNRNDLEDFLYPIVKEFFKSFENLILNNPITLNIYIEHDDNQNPINFNQYKLCFKDDIRCIEIIRLAKGLRLKRKYNHFKINISLTH